MKAFYSIIILISLFFVGFAQSNKSYPQWQHPILQQLRANSKNLIPFYNKDSMAFVTVSVLDKQKKTIYWFDCFGYYFDAVPINDKNSQALIAKKITAFKYYDLINTEYLNTITKARANFQSNGNKAIFTMYEKQLLQIDDSIKFPSTLKKLIELDKQKLSVERQIREFHSINPTKIIEDTTFSKTLSLQYGSMQTTYQNGDSITTYYNRIALEPVYKAVLNNSTASIKYLNRGNQLIDEIQFDNSKIELLRKEKTDVFLLYRGWLELQHFNIAENIKAINETIMDNNKGKSIKSQVQFVNTNNSLLILLSYSNQFLATTNYKIEYLTTIDRGFVSQLLRKQYQQVTNSLTANEAYLTTFTRGNKFYELTDARGNVMAVVTDKKLQHSSNGTAVDYYEPDVASATDYAPFGSPLPGRNFQSAEYRYGFNGKENDNEVKGEGNQQDYGMRIYDPRLGRFLSTDPLSKIYPMLTPYQFASNTPIQAVDLDGMEAFFIHGTSSSSSRWTETKSAKQAVQVLLKVTNNKYYNTGLNWKAPINNGEKMRATAAQKLADYVIEHKVEGEEITLIGHSHGGNVAIQAAKIIYEKTGQKVNIITIATPAYNKKGDKENPETQKAYINDHIAIWNKIDGVSGGLAGDDNYTNSTITTNVEVNVDKYYKKEVVVGVGSGAHKTTSEDEIGAHSADVEHPDVIQNAIDNKTLKPLKKVPVATNRN